MVFNDCWPKVRTFTTLSLCEFKQNLRQQVLDLCSAGLVVFAYRRRHDENHR